MLQPTPRKGTHPVTLVVGLALAVVLVGLVIYVQQTPLVVTPSDLLPAPSQPAVFGGVPAPTDAPVPPAAAEQVGFQGRRLVVNGVGLTLLAFQSARSLQYQTPPPGSLFVAYRFSVTNTTTSAVFPGIGDFTVTADGSQQGQVGFVANDAWTPELALDELAPGNTITGWMVFTVPVPHGRLVLTYSDSLIGGEPEALWTESCCP